MPEPFGPGRQRGRHLAKVCTARATGGGATGRSYVKTKRPRIGYVGWKWWKTHLRSLKVFLWQGFWTFDLSFFRKAKLQVEAKCHGIHRVCFLSYWRVALKQIFTCILQCPTFLRCPIFSWDTKDKSQTSARVDGTDRWKNNPLQICLKETASGWKTSHPNFHWRKKRALAAKKQLWVSWMDGCKATDRHHCQFPLPLSKKCAFETLALKTAETGPLTFQSNSQKVDPLVSLQRVESSNLQKRFKFSTSSEGSTFLQF